MMEKPSVPPESSLPTAVDFTKMHQQVRCRHRLFCNISQKATPKRFVASCNICATCDFIFIGVAANKECFNLSDCRCVKKPVLAMCDTQFSYKGKGLS